MSLKEQLERQSQQTLAALVADMGGVRKRVRVAERIKKVIPRTAVSQETFRLRVKQAGGSFQRSS